MNQRVFGVLPLNMVGNYFYLSEIFLFAPFWNFAIIEHHQLYPIISTKTFISIIYPCQKITAKGSDDSFLFNCSSLTARIPMHLLELLTASVHNTDSHVDLTVLADSDQLVWVLQQDDVRRFSRILLSFLDLFPGVRNDSSQCIWPRGARTGCQRGCHHQTGVAWWKNRREKDR